ncbi:MAG TPA: glycerol-3-phosphate 1-O-acyltransferase PlsY [Xanthobacteraceae bacterium]
MLHPINWSLALPYYSAALIFGYLVGSIPFGVILTRLAGTADLRSIGSGNIGATNVLRTGHQGLAAATLLCDVLKGTVAVLVMDWLWGRDHALIAGLGAFLGHLFPVWLKFRGGKGVATYLGVLLGLAPWPGAAAFAAIWLAVAGLTRYSSLAALVASAATPAVLWANDDRQEALWFVLLTVLVFVMHRSNIARLLSGTEGKIGGNQRAS